MRDPNSSFFRYGRRPYVNVTLGHENTLKPNVALNKLNFRTSCILWLHSRRPFTDYPDLYSSFFLCSPRRLNNIARRFDISSSDT